MPDNSMNLTYLMVRKSLLRDLRASQILEFKHNIILEQVDKTVCLMIGEKNNGKSEVNAH